MNVGMAWLRTHTRQWYILAVLLGVIALAFFHGTAHDVLFIVAVFAFLGACIRHVGLLVRGNDVARGMIGRGADSGGFALLDGGRVAQRLARPRARPSGPGSARRAGNARGT